MCERYATGLSICCRLCMNSVWPFDGAALCILCNETRTKAICTSEPLYYKEKDDTFNFNGSVMCLPSEYFKIELCLSCG